MKKTETQFQVIVDKKIKNDFIYLCRAGGSTASEQIRKIMIDFVNKNKQHLPKIDFDVEQKND
jgi:hypothetical protein